MLYVVSIQASLTCSKLLLFDDHKLCFKASFWETGHLGANLQDRVAYYDLSR